MDMEGPWSWDKIERKQLLEVQKKLSGLESNSWNEILVRDKHFFHSIAIEDLIVEAQQRLLYLRLDDLDQLISLRINGPNRVWGYRKEHILYLLWWDPDHEVCPYVKKGT